MGVDSRTSACSTRWASWTRRKRRCRRRGGRIWRTRGRGRQTRCTRRRWPTLVELRQDVRPCLVRLPVPTLRGFADRARRILLDGEFAIRAIGGALGHGGRVGDERSRVAKRRTRPLSTRVCPFLTTRTPAAAALALLLPRCLPRMPPPPLPLPLLCGASNELWSAAAQSRRRLLTTKRCQRRLC